MSVKYENKFEEAYKRIVQGIVDGMMNGAVLLETNIGNNTPVQYGLLKSQMMATGKVERSGTLYRTAVENQVEYAIHVEYGTSKMKASAMFRKGADESALPILKILNDNLPK